MRKILENFERRNQYQYNHKYSRSDIRLFVKQVFGLDLTDLQAVEGVHFCRGREMEKSKNFDKSRLIQWLTLQVPIL